MTQVPRWELDARERFVAAALELFSAQRYDTTSVEIAARAGLTKNTFFRYFPDKRELLTAGQQALSRLLLEGISTAPPGCHATGCGLRQRTWPRRQARQADGRLAHRYERA